MLKSDSTGPPIADNLHGDRSSLKEKLAILKREHTAKSWSSSSLALTPSQATGTVPLKFLPKEIHGPITSSRLKIPKSIYKLYLARADSTRKLLRAFKHGLCPPDESRTIGWVWDSKDGSKYISGTLSDKYSELITNMEKMTRVARSALQWTYSTILLLNSSSVKSPPPPRSSAPTAER